MFRCFSVLLVAMSVLHPTLAEAEDTLESHRRTYAVRTQKIEDEHEAKLDDLLNDYSRSLSGTIQTLTAKGDPEPVTLALAEKERFERDRTVPNPPADDLPSTLQTIQLNHQRKVQEAQTEKAKDLKTLTIRYIAALDRLMRAHTRNGELDLAFNAKEEKRRAQSILADLSAKLERAAKRARLPVDAIAWNGHHYKILDEDLNWYEAERKCEKLGGHLVTINSANELAFIRHICARRTIFLGATDVKQEGKWVWLDGTPLSGMRWAGGAPSDKRSKVDEDWLLMYHQHGGINDCGYKHSGPRTLCEWDY